MSADDSIDLESQIYQLLDGELTQQEASLLDVKLRSDPSARALYLQAAAMHSELENHYASHSGIGDSQMIPIDRFMARQRRRIIQFSLSAAAAAIAIFAGVMWFSMVNAPENLASYATSSDSVFTLTHTNGKDNLTDNILRVGSRLQLSHGSFEARFKSGVRCVIKAPSDLKFLTENRIAIKQGEAWFHVPPAGVGFTVETSKLDIVDLGTEFGLSTLLDGSEEVHVIKGAVQLAKLKSKDQIILKANQAMQLNPEGKFVEVLLDKSRFLTSLSVPHAIKNSDFEVLSADMKEHDSIGYGPVKDWATSGLGVGLSNQDQPFLNQPAHSGSHVAFIQGKGMISQSVSGFDSDKKYSVTYFVSERGFPDALTHTAASLDLGSNFYQELQPIRKTDAFRRIVTGPLTVFGPTANIEIHAQRVSGDATLLIDSVSVSRAVPVVADGGFENPVQPVKTFKQAPGIGTGSLVGSEWNFSNGSGVTTNGSDFAPPVAPEGSQAAILQDVASIETIVEPFEPSVTYCLKLKAAGRKGGEVDFQVILDGKPLTFKSSETISPAIGAYQSYISDSFTTSGGSLPLLIQSNGSGTTFIDDIHFEFVAEAE